MIEHREAEIVMFPARRAPAPEPDIDGWRMMPERLTVEMVDAAGHAMDDFRRDGGKGFIGMVQAMYEAMKAAAPEPEDAA